MVLLIFISRPIAIFAEKNTLMNLLDANADKIVSLCKKHKVNQLFAFGSVLNLYLKENIDRTKALIHG